MSFTWTAADARRSRAYTTKLTELAEEGVIDWETLARDLMGWMSEDEVERFALSNDYVPEMYEDEDYDDSMDGDFDSGMASAGYGMDEDYA